TLDDDSTTPNANRAKSVRTSTLYEKRLGSAIANEPSENQTYGSDGLTYDVLTHEFSQTLCSDSATNVEIDYEYDGDEWRELSTTGSLVFSSCASYTESASGTYAQDGVSGTFSNQIENGEKSVTCFNLDAKTGCQKFETTAKIVSSFSESGTFDGGALTRSQNVTSSSANAFEYSTTFENVEDARDEDWILEKITLGESTTVDAKTQYEKSVGFEDYSDYVDVSGNVTVKDFSDVHKTEETQAYECALEETWVRDAETERYELQEATGARSCDYALQTLSYCKIVGAAVNESAGFTEEGDVLSLWGDQTTEKLCYVAELKPDGEWDYKNLKVGSEEQVEFSLNAFRASEDRDVGVLAYSYLSGWATKSGGDIGVKKNAIGVVAFQKFNRYTETTSFLKWDYESVYVSTSGEPGDRSTNESTTRRGVCTNQTTRYEYDGDGVSRLVSPKVEKIGDAYSYVSSRYAYEWPYSRAYEKSGGTVYGTETSDTFRSEKIDATVYYDQTRYRQYYV
ncbi:MAG: hypothetical protein IJY15_12080, partial [Thermoguttaceae bacterium]|nr:hypothetical protein [Thermoguttaceae bacterium]